MKGMYAVPAYVLMGVVCLLLSQSISADCGVGCNNCTKTICSSTMGGYFLSNGTALACTPNCQACKNSSSNACTTANWGFYLVSGTPKSCAQNCGACKGAAVANCTAPMEGFFFNGSSILACTANCAKCTSAAGNACTTAAMGFFLSSGKPIPCAGTINGTRSCDQCTSNATNACTVCSPGFAMKSGTCYNNGSCQTPNWGFYNINAQVSFNSVSSTNCTTTVCYMAFPNCSMTPPNGPSGQDCCVDTSMSILTVDNPATCLVNPKQYTIKSGPGGKNYIISPMIQVNNTQGWKFCMTYKGNYNLVQGNGTNVVFLNPVTAVKSNMPLAKANDSTVLGFANYSWSPMVIQSTACTNCSGGNGCNGPNCSNCSGPNCGNNTGSYCQSNSMDCSKGPNPNYYFTSASVSYNQTTCQTIFCYSLNVVCPPSVNSSCCRPLTGFQALVPNNVTNCLVSSVPKYDALTTGKNGLQYAVYSLPQAGPYKICLAYNGRMQLAMGDSQAGYINSVSLGGNSSNWNWQGVDWIGVLPNEVITKGCPNVSQCNQPCPKS